MNLPHDHQHKTVARDSRKTVVDKPHKHTWIAVLSIVAIVFSVLSAGFSTFLYVNTPSQIHNYVQSHKNELKGEDGRDGADGRDGVNSRSSTYCSGYDYGFGYSSLNCY